MRCSRCSRLMDRRIARSCTRCGRKRSAPHQATNAWRSLVWTLILMGGAAWGGHLLCSHQHPWAGSSFGIQVCTLHPNAVSCSSSPLPKHNQPTEQSNPRVPFSPPLLDVTLLPQIPDNSTTPDEPPTLLPLLPIPENLSLLPEQPRPVQRNHAQKAPTKTAATSHPNRPDTVPPITPPAYKKAPPPPYPADMRASRIHGVVRVRIAVSAEGNPTTVQIISGSGHARLDSAACDWILRYWTFRPARRGEIPVASSVTTSVEFTLDKT